MICLQETKVPDALFPAGAPAELGYGHAAWRGMKGYNGVAIFSRAAAPGARLRAGLVRPRRLPAPRGGAGDARRSGRVAVHNFYVPAGGDVPDREANPKYGHKLDFIAEATTW